MLAAWWGGVGPIEGYLCRGGFCPTFEVAMASKEDDSRSSLPALRPGARFVARVEDLTAEGDGVVRTGGLVVFVPGAVPGDRVQVQLQRIQKNRGEGELTAILEPSPARREPPCPFQAACGGCPLMVLDEETALALKARHLQQVLRRIGGIETEVEPVLPSPHALRYRSRVRFAVRPRDEGLGFGFRPRGEASAVVPVADCLLVPERAAVLAAQFLSRLDRITAQGRPWPEQLDLRCSVAHGEWLLVVYGPAGGWREANAAAAGLLDQVPDLAGVVRAATRGARIVEERLLAGRDSVVEEICGLDVELGATTFLQVNPPAAELLYRHAARELAGGTTPRRLLDLYCGVGLLGLTAGPEVDLVGCELHPGAVDRARRAAARAGRDDARFITGEAVAVTQELAAQGERFDRVALNPPRSGAGPRLAQAVRELEPERVVIVSCHPAALARDLKEFTVAGFRVEKVAAVDLFPQTPHLEAVVTLVPRSDSESMAGSG